MSDRALRLSYRLLLAAALAFVLLLAAIAGAADGAQAPWWKLLVFQGGAYLSAAG